MTIKDFFERLNSDSQTDSIEDALISLEKTISDAETSTIFYIPNKRLFRQHGIVNHYKYFVNEYFFNYFKHLFKIVQSCNFKEVQQHIQNSPECWVYLPIPLKNVETIKNFEIDLSSGRVTQILLVEDSNGDKKILTFSPLQSKENDVVIGVNYYDVC